MNLELKEFKIDRSKWRSGSSGTNQVGKGDTKLLNDQGYMCCLGQCLQQMGASANIIQGKPYPSQWNQITPFVDRLGTNEFGWRAIYTNDGLHTTPQEKESALISLFQENGLKLEFYGEYDNNSN